MGGCIGSPRHGNSQAISIGKNQPLKSDRPKWKSDIPFTDSQLHKKRDEFWDTAPAFEGRKEIWDALKAAAFAIETGDHQLAQAIVDGASITLPNGTLLDCYDELGTRYQLPLYVLSAPSNVIEDRSDNTTDGGDSANASPTLKHGTLIPLKFRLSDAAKDIKLTVSSTDTVLKVKRVIHEQEGVDPQRQRWFFGGRLIGDKLKICDAKIPKGCLVQVIVSETSLPTNRS